MAEQPSVYSQKDLRMLDVDTLAEYLQRIMEWFGENLHKLTPAFALQYSTIGIYVCNLLAQMEGDESYLEIADILGGDTELIQVEALRKSMAALNMMRYLN